jgi:hypothetical protein
MAIRAEQRRGYTSPEYGFKLTLPSSRWREKKLNSGAVAFHHGGYEMLAVIQGVRPVATPEEYRAYIGGFQRDMNSQTPNRHPAVREGVNQHGNPFWYMTMIDSTLDGKDFFAAAVICWRKEAGQVVRVFFEGHERMWSAGGKAAELQAFELASQDILLSVE